MSWSWVILVVIILACIVTTIVFNNHSMRQTLDEASNADIDLIQEAAEHSVKASNMEKQSLLLQLTEAVHGFRTMQVLIRRYNGVEKLSQSTSMNCEEILHTLKKQVDGILQSICNDYPHLVPKGELKNYMGFISKRDADRDGQDLSDE